MERRPRRQRRPVRYFNDGEHSDGDSEDDFASAPPSKKPKEEVPSSVTVPARQEKPKKCTPVKGTKTRLSRDEKQFSRDLQRVIESSSQPSDKVYGACVGGRGVSEGESTAVDGSADSTQLKALVGGSDKENDSDFTLDDEEDESVKSSTEEASDSDFTASPSPKPKTKGRKAKSTSDPCKPRAKKVTARTTGPPRGTKEPVTPGPMCTVSLASPPLSKATPTATGLTGLPGGQARPPGLGVGRTPKWTPPARVGSNVDSAKAASPSSTSGNSGIRVGLSRNARIKPLHSRTS